MIFVVVVLFFCLFCKCSVLTGMDESSSYVSVMRTLSKMGDILEFIASLLYKYHPNFNSSNCFLKHSKE